MAESSLVDDHLKCSVCLEYYSEPRRLPCDHVFCSTCLEGLCQGSSKFPCPECRAVVNLGVKGIQDLRQDRKLASIVSVLTAAQKKAEEPKNYECGIHGKVADIYCQTCKQLVCNKCSFGGEHHSHALIEIENKVQIEKKSLSEQKQRILQCMEKLGKSEAMLKKNTVDIRGKAVYLQAELKNTFARLRDALEKKELELIEMIKSDVSSRVSDTSLAIKELQNLQENFKECLKQIDECTDDLGVLKNSATIGERNSVAFAHYDSANVAIPRTKAVAQWKELRDVELNVTQTLTGINNIPAYTEDDCLHLAKKVLQSRVSMDENLIKFFRKLSKHKEIIDDLAKEYNCTVLWEKSTSKLHLQFENYFESDIECFQNRLASQTEQYNVKRMNVEKFIWRDVLNRIRNIVIKSPDDIAVFTPIYHVCVVGLQTSVAEVYNLILKQRIRAWEACRHSTSVTWGIPHQ